ncbi:MAG: hypothetical protein AB8B96_16215 [Lysobacterales bacterium]
MPAKLFVTITLMLSALQASGAQLLVDRLRFDQNAGTRVETLITDAAGVALASEIPIALNPNSGVGGSTLTFDQANTGLSRSFTLTAIEGGGITFDDDEGGGNLPNFDNALSIGDLDNFENDDWVISVTSGEPLRIFGFTLRDTNGTAGEAIALLDSGGAVIEILPMPDLGASTNTFVGIVSEVDFFGLRFDEDTGGDDIAIANFVFAVDENATNGVDDGFEIDDQPQLASRFPNALEGQIQSHTLTPGDEDWIYWELAENTGCSSDNFPFFITVTSDTPGFQPIFETFPSARLADPGVSATDVLGACGTTAPAGTTLQLPAEFLFRVRHCPTAPQTATYSYTFQPIDAQFVCAPLATISGQVLEAGSNAPVGGLFILSSDNIATVSDPADGSYSIVVLQTATGQSGAENLSLRVLTDEFQGGEATIAQVAPNASITQDLILTRPDTVFSNGFE